jgi:tetratricopeptide (TPR) repeat protein
MSLALAGGVRAQESDKNREAVLEEARQHVARAKVHYDLGEFKEAADEYIIVYRLRPIPALLFNIAQAYRQGGLYDKAKQFYKTYLRESPDLKNKAMIEQAIREMDEALAKQKKAKDAAPTGVKTESVADARSGDLPLTGKPPEPPQVAGTPKITETPKATETPKVSETPKATDTPKVTETPKVSETPKVAQASKQPKGPEPVKPEQPAVAPAGTRMALAAPAASRPSAGVAAGPARTVEKTRTWTWVAAGGAAAALAAGGVFGAKTLSSASPDDAMKANVLFGVGGALAIASAALFAFDF